MKGLTDRQRRFVEAYTGPAKGVAALAARMAGYSPTYSNRTGPRLKTFPHVRALLDAWEREEIRRLCEQVAAWRERERRSWSALSRGRRRRARVAR